MLMIGLSIAVVSTGQNLVSNGSFETKEPGTGCPNQTGFDNGRPQGWFVSSVNGFTPDYFFPCASPGSSWYPGSNSQGCEYPLQGQAYTGLAAMVVQSDGSVLTAGSEYMQQQISLTANQQYYVEFWVSAANINSNNTFVKTLGMYFRRPDVNISDGANKGLHHLVPQIPNAFPAANFYSNTNGWAKISGNFTPNVGGTWTIIIGNFDSGLNNNPSTPTSSPSSGYRQSYYYIDAVTVQPVGQSIPDYTTQLSGDALACSNSNTSYSITNLPFGTSVSWSQSSNLVAISGQGTSNYTVAPQNGSTFGHGYVQATISGACSDSNLVLRKDIWVGQPTITYHPPGLNPCTDNEYFEGPNVPGLSYQWSVDNPNVWFTIGTTYSNAAIISTNPEYFNITLTVSSGGCQTSVTLFSYTSGYYCQCFFDPSCGGFGGFSVSPNPAGKELVIEFSNEQVYEFEATLVNELGEIKRSMNIKKHNRLDISGLPNGLYYLNVYHKSGKKESRRIQITRH